MSELLKLKMECFFNKNITQQAKSLFCYIVSNFGFNVFELKEVYNYKLPYLKIYFRELTLENFIKREENGFVVNKEYTQFL